MSSEKDHEPKLEDLSKISTAESVVVPRELLEKMYLNPPNPVKGDLRKTFGNPTPICIVGLILSAFPLCCDLMGWRGAGGQGAASIPAYIFLGGVVQLIGAVLEFFLGNTFSFVLFGTLAGFLFTFGCTLIPAFNATAAYSPSGSAVEGLMTPEFSASFAFFLLATTIIISILTVLALRTNVVLFVGLIDLDVTLGILTGSFFRAAEGDMAAAKSLMVGGGAALFLLMIIAFYLFIALMLAAVDFPFQIPVGDLSWIPGYTDRMKAKKAREHEA